MRTVIAALIGTLALGSSGVWAAREPVDASMYRVRCDTVIGKISFDPPLSFSGSATSAKAKVKASLDGCTATPDDGNPPVAIESGSVSGELLGTSNNCAILLGGVPTSGALAIKWKTTPKLSSSSSMLTVGTLGFSTFTPGFPFTGTYGTFHVGGLGVSVSGSFQGSDGGASSVADGATSQDVNVLLDACSSDSGLKVINFGFEDIML